MVVATSPGISMVTLRFSARGGALSRFFRDEGHVDVLGVERA
jgi:hypothetical protein